MTPDPAVEAAAKLSMIHADWHSIPEGNRGGYTFGRYAQEMLAAADGARQAQTGDEFLALGLEPTNPAETYLPELVEVWIGNKWDIGRGHDGRFHVYRKGNWQMVVGSMQLALAIVADDQGNGVTDA